ncbi:hypothetical protein ElyMa_002159500 [Elysia marginata]|uniref:Peptidase A2 domain-containing protein n=1 Tax=Elysia marginata TaxID=1093978 RepID=A0AAV4FLV3_9GAST|nr:hypothetical protein ElyMa_002159500 [Elysia marginata]
MSEEPWGREITIQSLKSGSTFHLKLTLQGIHLQATVDTAAEVTIIADHIFNRLQNKPPVRGQVIMHAAGREQKITAQEVGPVTIKVGKDYRSEETIYVAPIKDDMLLGLDYLLKHAAKLDLERGYLSLHDQIFELGREDNIQQEDIVAQISGLVIMSDDPGGGGASADEDVEFFLMYMRFRRVADVLPQGYVSAQTGGRGERVTEGARARASSQEPSGLGGPRREVGAELPVGREFARAEAVTISPALLGLGRGRGLSASTSGSSRGSLQSALPALWPCDKTLAQRSEGACFDPQLSQTKDSKIGISS